MLFFQAGVVNTIDDRPEVAKRGERASLSCFAVRIRHTPISASSSKSNTITAARADTTLTIGRTLRQAQHVFMWASLCVKRRALNKEPGTSQVIAGS